MSKGQISHVVGIDDAPFEKNWRGDVPIVATVFSQARLEGVLMSKVRRDGVNSTRTISNMIKTCRFVSHLQAVLLQGIALAGFNVIDIHKLHKNLGIPVLVIARKKPNMEGVRNALLKKVKGGKRKWALIENAGNMESLSNVYVQRAGIDKQNAKTLIKNFAIHSQIPEPLRSAHLIAGAITQGQSTASRV